MGENYSTILQSGLLAYQNESDFNDDELTTLLLENLPKKPYCGNNKRAERILPVHRALDFEYIQFNHPEWLNWIIIDVDHDTYMAWYELGLPRPNIISRNIKTGNYHIKWLLSDPIPNTEKSRMKPVLFYKAVRRALVDILAGDESYNGSFSKNPINEMHEKFYYGNHTTSLHEFYKVPEVKDFCKKRAADYKKTGKKSECRDKEKREYDTGSRNCDEFKRLCFEFAYPKVKDFSSYEEFYAGCNDFIHCNYSEIENISHLNHITKSVANYVWRNRHNFKNYSNKRRVVKPEDRKKARTERKIKKAWKQLQEKLARQPKITELSDYLKMSRSGLYKTHKNLLDELKTKPELTRKDSPTLNDKEKGTKVSHSAQYKNEFLAKTDNVIVGVHFLRTYQILACVFPDQGNCCAKNDRDYRKNTEPII